MKKVCVWLALSALGLCSAAASGDIFVFEGGGIVPPGGLPVTVPVGSPIFYFDWTLSFSGLGPGGSSAGIDEALEVLKVSDFNPNDHYSIWRGDRTIAPIGTSLPGLQTGQAYIDLSGFEGSTIRVGFNIWFTSADHRDDSAAYINNIQFLPIPEPSTLALLPLAGSFLIWKRSGRRKDRAGSRNPIP